MKIISKYFLIISNLFVEKHAKNSKDVVIILFFDKNKESIENYFKNFLIINLKEFNFIVKLKILNQEIKEKFKTQPIKLFKKIKSILLNFMKKNKEFCNNCTDYYLDNFQDLTYIEPFYSRNCNCGSNHLLLIENRKIKKNDNEVCFKCAHCGMEYIRKSY